VERNNTGKDAPMNNDDDGNVATNDIFLNRDEFLRLATTPIQESHDVTDKDDATVFGLFDVDEKVYISVHDLQRVATELNWCSSPEEDEHANPPTNCNDNTHEEQTTTTTTTPSSSLLWVTHHDVTEMIYRLD
jgi:Ca2+-binding EF-hand superfamily protein